MLSVGIITMPGSPRLGPDPVSYITYDNYKWLTRAGFTVVPIPVGCSDAEALVYASQIQGLYLAGGPFDEPVYRRLAFRLLDVAYKASLPVWGTCHGFQILLQWCGATLDSLDAMRLQDATLTIKAKGRLLHGRTLRPQHLHLSHSFGITLAHFEANRRLTSLFRVLATSHDRNGTEYVSILEGRTIPFYGVQFHPELTRSLDWMAAVFQRGMRHPSSKAGGWPPPVTLSKSFLRPCGAAWSEYHTTPPLCFVFHGHQLH